MELTEQSQARSNDQCLVVDVDPQTLEQWLESGQAVLVDVREPFEHASERIPGAVLIPLSKFTPESVRERFGDRRVVFHCRSGKRSHKAASQLATQGQQAFHLAGGIEAWKAAGKRVERSASAPRLDIMRQVQITAGSLVAIGTLLGAAVNPWFLIIPGFVGCGLIFAGATGWCGMAKLLAKMPWNRASCTTGCDAC